MRFAVADADSLVWAAASSAQDNYSWDDDTTTTSVDPSKMVRQLDETIEFWQDTLDARVIIVLSDPKANWRKLVLPTYKSNRKQAKPKLFFMGREYLKEHYEVWERPTLEADDVCGILATHPRALPKGDRIVVSIDKDLRQVPCVLWNPQHPEVKPAETTGHRRYHMLQTLTGDTVDGYGGCPGIGPKKAELLLDAYDEDQWWEAICKAYAAKDLTEEYALTQARVARICLYQDFDYQKKEVKLWNPS
jgi:DNA polymerase I